MCNHNMNNSLVYALVYVKIDELVDNIKGEIKRRGMEQTWTPATVGLAVLLLTAVVRFALERFVPRFAEAEWLAVTLLCALAVAMWRFDVSFI